MCQITIQKQKEIAEAEARQNQPKQVLHTDSCHWPYIPEYVGNHPAAYVASASSHRLLGHSFHLRHHYNLPIHEDSSQKGANRPISGEISGRNPKLAVNSTVPESKHIYWDISYLWSIFTFIVILFLIRNSQCKPSFLVIFYFL
jgi:hypothetical protein